MKYVFGGWDLQYHDEAKCGWYKDTDTSKHIYGEMKQCTHFLRRDNVVWRYKQNHKNT